MSPESHDALAADPVLARAAAADRRSEARLATAIDDFFLAEHDRLDDRTRAALGALVATTVAAVEREIAGHAARLKGGRGMAERVDAATEGTGVALPRLIDSGLLRDRDIMSEWLGQVRQDLLGESLLVNRGPDPAPNLLGRLAACADGVVAAAATAYLVADSRRRSPAALRRTELPAELHHRIVWWVAAALREADAAVEDRITRDRALAESALRSLAAHDEGDRLEAVAVRLAAAIDARPGELGELLTDALVEGRVALFVAAIAQAQAIDYGEAREMVLDPAGDRLWLALRAQGLERAMIAQVGLALAEADHRRDLDGFADALDAIVAVPSAAAREALAPLGLHRDFRTALRALALSARR